MSLLILANLMPDIEKALPLISYCMTTENGLCSDPAGIPVSKRAIGRFKLEIIGCL